MQMLLTEHLHLAFSEEKGSDTDKKIKDT